MSRQKLAHLHHLEKELDFWRINGYFFALYQKIISEPSLQGIQNEKNISTAQPEEKKQARISRANENQRRPRCAEAPSRQGKKKSNGERPVSSVGFK